KDKIKFTDSAPPTKGDISIPALGKEAVSALVMLGFTQYNSQKVVAKVLKENSSSTVEAIIKEALKRL
ncbi:MAG: Holliday junction branch migration protein RuvA, partial [Dysgonamonadaceae bacterium]